MSFRHLPPPGPVPPRANRPARLLLVAVFAGWALMGGGPSAMAGPIERFAPAMAAAAPASAAASAAPRDEAGPDASEDDEALAARISARVEWLYQRLMVPLLAACVAALVLFTVPTVRRSARALAQPIGPRSALHGIALAAFGYFAFAAAGALIAIGGRPSAGDYAAPIAALGGQALALTALLAMIRSSQGLPLRAVGLGGREAGHRGVPVLLTWSVLLYFAQLPGLVGCMQLAGLVFPRQVQPQVLDIARHPELIYRLLYGVAVVGLAPILEELIFRGLLMDAARRLGGPAVGVIVSALLFMIVHTPEAYIPIFWLGLVLAIAYHYTGSLVAPIAIHLLHNLGQFLMLLWATSGT